MTRSLLTAILTSCMVTAFMCCNSPHDENESTEQPALAEEPRTEAQTLLNKTLAYHDPEGNWSDYKATITQESRMLNSDDTTTVRTRKVTLDNSRAYFSMEAEAGGHTIRRMVIGDSVCMSEWEKPDMTTEDSTAMNLTCEAAENYRNYFRYLIGLPMVLQDSATILSEGTGTEELFGQTYRTLTVNYLPEGEQPEWTFYIDTADYHLAAARFVKPDSTGEYILLENITEHNDVRNFGTFEWYYLDKKPLARENYTFR